MKIKTVKNLLKDAKQQLSNDKSIVYGNISRKSFRIDYLTHKEAAIACSTKSNCDFVEYVIYYNVYKNDETDDFDFEFSYISTLN